MVADPWPPSRSPALPDEPSPKRSRPRRRSRSQRARAERPAAVPARWPSRPEAACRRTARRVSAPARSKPGGSPSLRWVPWIVLALIAAAFLVSSLASSSSSKADLTYSEFVQAVDDGNVKSIEFNKSTGEINGVFTDAAGRQEGVHELRPEGRPARGRPEDAAGRRTSTSSTSTRAATCSATSCCGCCRSC